MKYSACLLLSAVAALTLAGCQSVPTMVPKVDVADTSAVRPQPVAAPILNNGSIFQSGHYRPLFEDHRARLIGDSLNVQIVEKVS
ncbi:MAG: flgH, partial [Rhizobacter sp.]|nr:flgH [Rhizobacter sp.]